MEKFKKTDKICRNCKNVIWMVGIGQGIRCSYGYKYEKGMPPPPKIPSGFHTCEHFELKKELKDKAE